MSTPSSDEVDFGRALKSLLSAAGLTPDAVLAELVGRASSPSRSSLYDWLRNSHLPEDEGPVMEVVVLCLGAANRRGVSVASGLQDLSAWRRLLAEAKQARDGRAAIAIAGRGGERRRGPSGPGIPIGRWNPVALGVHAAIGGKAPEYVLREHDKLLRALLDPAVASGRIVVLRGTSSTGKTRAAYEAVRECLPDWLVDYPRTPKLLAARLKEGWAPRTVVWLDELRYFTSPDAQVMAELADMLTTSSRVVVIATLWPAQWAAYTREYGPALDYLHPDDELRRSRRADSLIGLRPLLQGLPELSTHADAFDAEFGGIIDVPERFTEAEIRSAIEQRNHTVIRAIRAAKAAGSPGMVAQYLAGVQDLEAHYCGPGADPYGTAVITAAMDAARFGHASALSESLLHDAVIGYLDDSLRTIEQERWWPRALEYATRELRGTVIALEPVPPVVGTGIDAYRLADYLDQLGRRIRQSVVGPASLWEAVTANTSQSADLSRIGQSAFDRGLYRYAAKLWKRAILAGGTGAIENLLSLLRRAAPHSAGEAADWVAAHVAVTSPADVYKAYEVLRSAGYEAAARALAARAAHEVRFDDPDGLAQFLDLLHRRGEKTRVTAVVRRLKDSAPGSVRLSSRLVDVLGQIGEQGTVVTLAFESSHAKRTTNSGAPAALAAADEAGDEHYQASDGAPDRYLAGQRALLSAGAIGQLLRGLHAANADRELELLADRAAERFPLDDPGDVIAILDAFRASGRHEASGRLLARRPETQVSLGDTRQISRLYGFLREAGYHETALALAQRFATHAPIETPRGLHHFFNDLVEAGEREVASRLARRAVARRALRPLAWTIMHTWDGVWLIGELYRAGEEEAALALAAQVAEEKGPRSPFRVDGTSDLLAITRRMKYEYADHVTRAVNALFVSDDRVQGSLENPWRVADNLKWLHRASATEAIEALLARRPAEAVSLEDPGGIGRLLGTLRRLPGAAADEARKALLERQPQNHVRITDAGGLALLLRELGVEGAASAVESLLGRISDEFKIAHARGVPALLVTMRQAGATDTAELACRAAAEVSLADAGDAAELLVALATLDDPGLTVATAKRAADEAVLEDTREVANLLDALQASGSNEAVRILAARAADAGYYSLLVKRRLGKGLIFGREPDGTSLGPWAWRDI